MPDVVTTPTETVSAVAQLLESAARIHEDRGDAGLADRFRMRAEVVRGMLEG